MATTWLRGGPALALVLGLTACGGGGTSASGATDATATVSDGGPVVGDGAHDADPTAVDAQAVPLDACTAGLLGCPCDGTSCAAGLVCDGRGLCAEATESGGRTVDRRCYSPCTESLVTTDGVLLRCDAEGLMQTCTGGLVCNDGTCVAEGAPKPACERDSQCPEWQACMGGGCYANCASSADCASDVEQCHRRVCRQKCTTTRHDCPSDTTCRLADGSSGVCMPEASTPSDPPEQGGAFELSTPMLSLTSATTQGEFTIKNSDTRRHTYTVTKVEHSSLDGDGRTVETERPLFWLSMGSVDEVARVDTFTLDIAGGESATVRIEGGFNEALVSWSGVLKVAGEGSGEKFLGLDFTGSPEGQWRGALHTFINFEDQNLDAWISARTAAAARATKNAFLIKWQQFRESAGSVVSPDEMRAVLSATFSGAWDTAGTRAACAEKYPDGVSSCYLFVPDGSAEASDGVRRYSDNAEILVPTGHLEMPFAVNLRAQGEGGRAWEGRVVTDLALQYPSNPPVALEFGSDPTTCEDEDSTTCISPVSSFLVTSVVGGRFLSTEGDCAPNGLAGFETNPEPWLVPNFVEGTRIDPATDRRVRSECREFGFPLPPTSPLNRFINRNAAGANPIPDGRARARTLELIDGVMVNQTTIWLIVREKFDSFLDPVAGNTSMSAYGIIVLDQVAADLEDDDFNYGRLPPMPQRPAGLLPLTCEPGLVESVLGAGQTLSARNAARAAEILTEGVARDAAVPLEPDSDWEAHYLCHDTGHFDGGRPDWAQDDAVDERCPSGSRVTYFLVRTAGLMGNEVSEEACQGAVGCPADASCDAAPPAANADPGAASRDLRGTCAATLAEWVETGLAMEGPAWRCAEVNSTYCEGDGRDLRAGKVFYEPMDDTRVLTPLVEAVREAFRYKTRFRSRTGAAVGFVPVVCPQGGDLSPYCYDPQSIEDLRARMDCLIHVYATYAPGFAGLDGRAQRERLKKTLEEQFSGYYWPPLEPGQAVPPEGPNEDGFERLYAELLIMLGDDAATRALGSRFDLAGSAIGVFDGDLFEPDGLSLTGGAGYEMRLLYQGTQSYRLVVERFHRLASILWREMADRDANFVTADTLERYFDRVMLASTKSVKLASEKVERYLRFSRPDVARRVVERDYPLAYLEGTFFSKFLRRYLERLGPEASAQRPQVIEQLRKAQLKYGTALNRLRESHGEITDDLTVFGFAPDYVPFVALGAFDTNAVRVLVDRAYETLRVAKEREDRALASTRAFDTDAAQFQSELVQIRNRYEDDLADLCGTVTSGDGRVLPAIAKYAEFSGVASALGNPCGRLGTGKLFASLGGFDTARLDLQIAIRNIRELYEKVAVEQERVQTECAGRVALNRLEFEAEGEVVTFESEIARSRQEIARIEREMGMWDRGIGIARQVVATVAAASQAEMNCSPQPGPPPTLPNVVACAAGVGAALGQGGLIAAETSTTVAAQLANDQIDDTETAIAAKEAQAGNLKRASTFDQALKECCLDADSSSPDVDTDTCQHPGPVLINSNAMVDKLMLDLYSAELAVLRAELGVRLALGRISALRAESERLLTQQAEAEALTFNVQAARNDPNVRLFKNSAVEDADKSFKDALSDVYRATRIVEYYTQQSYPEFERLFLARMVGRGEFSLENYLFDLQRAYRAFEESNGTPALRVARVSLKDDIFKIPLDQGIDDRGALFRARLADPRYLDGDGTRSFPFATGPELVSPLTAIHKIDHIEVNIEGEGNLGDKVGRIYLTQQGSGVVNGLDGARNYYAFPKLTTVVNTYFKGEKYSVFDQDVYSDARLRDRPLLNTLWTLGLNTKEEAANRDIPAEKLSDIVIFFFYRDFARDL